MRDIYQERGYDNRKDYLNSLADEYELPLETVRALVGVLGPNEDFDGLVTNLKDASSSSWFKPGD